MTAPQRPSVSTSQSSRTKQPEPVGWVLCLSGSYKRPLYVCQYTQNQTGRYTMGIFEVVFQSSLSSVSLLGALLVLLLVYFISTWSFSSEGKGNEPPGPKPLPLLGNLLQLDLDRPFNTFLELSKKYGPVFTVYLGSNKVVVLAGYKAVKEALVNKADEFGERDSPPIFKETTHGYGVIWSNGDLWREMRRFALTNLRDFGMGKRACEDKITEECDYLVEVFKKFKGEAFDTTAPMNCAVSNVICSMVYGSRFEYDDPEFTSLVERTNQNVQIAGSASMQLYNTFPWLGKLLLYNKKFNEALDANIDQNVRLFGRLKETLNPQMCRGFVDSFLVRKQNLESSLSSVSLLGALLVLLLVYFISTWSFSSEGKGNVPPGPKPLPLLGNLLQLDRNRPFNTFLELSKKYGPVFTVYLGSKKVVVVAGYKAAKEALVNKADEFGERDPPQIFKELADGHGVLWSNGDSWREMRRFALTNLRDFGMGKRACEDKITEECDYLVEVFKTFKGEAFDTTVPVNCAVSNIICSMVYGSRFEYDDPEFTSLVERTNQNVQIAGSPSMQLYNMFPWLGKLFISKKFNQSVDANSKQNLELFSRLKETLNPQMCRGFVDAFLVRKQNLEESGVTNSHFHEKNLLSTVMNLFAAGTDTTATTLRWGFLLMAKYPKIQDQVQEELSRAIGTRPVQVEDRKNLPFVDAVIHEVQRLASIVPMALPHRTSQDVTLEGFFIEKGTTVFPLLTSVLYDEDEWEKPRSFHPAHFLDKDGKFVKRDAFMPFSAGRRVCLGESLARMELFLFFSTFLQRFRFSPAPGVSEDDLDLTPRVGLTLNPSPHKLCAVPL
ncbi:cytochrome P450 2K4-like [Solea solea]|uniref:cytochrome P450 2K4-like n=1 Tax=Solea solea TaxID=90069 RepID=UPI00272B3AFF|nr:cytochrome P450 2K4-like [Solea solea]